MVFSPEGDTLKKLEFTNHSDPIFSLKEALFSECSKVEVFASDTGEKLASSTFSLDKLLADFNPDPSKPVMLYIGDRGKSFSDNKRDHGLLRAVNDLFLTASANRRLESLHKEYGNNLLVIPEHSDGVLDAIAKKLPDFVTESTPLQVFVFGHHRASAGLYSINGLPLSEKSLDRFLNNLPTSSENLTVIHDACDVMASRFTKGNHIVVAPVGNYSIHTPGILGEITSPSQCLIPLLAKNAPQSELQDALDGSWAVSRQNLINQVGTTFLPGPQSSPQILQPSKSR